MPQILMPYTVHLDHTLRVTPMSTLFSKGDSAAHRFELTIIRAGKREDLTDCTVFGKFYSMADSAVVSVPGSVEDGKAVVVLDAACYDYIGRFALTISIKKGEEETTVFYGDGYMHGQRADTSISGEYIIYDINTLLEKIADIDAATQAANTAASNANTATANANTATGKANTAANAANTAATNANTAKDAANSAAVKINNMTVSATPVETGTATAALTTVDGHYHLALGMPKGDTGATPQISVEVTTGAAGSEAYVSVTGTAENPVIHLTIPRGDTGAVENLTINGKPVESGTITLSASDVKALPENGTAKNSEKLGGKIPKVYTPHTNLADNSDFEHFVSQTTLGANHGDTPYGGDRWILERGTISGEWDYERNGYRNVTLNGKMVQVVPSPFPSVATPFVNMVSGTATIEYDAAKGEIIIESAGGVIKNVMLLEGEWTEKPEYVSKGYAAEFAMCQKYYYFVDHYDYGYIGTGNAFSETGAWFAVTLPSKMRHTPTVKIPAVYCDNGSGVVADATDIYVAGAYANIVYCLATVANMLNKGNLHFRFKAQTDAYAAFYSDLPRRT